jgi:hypothetical protein
MARLSRNRHGGFRIAGSLLEESASSRFALLFMGGGNCYMLVYVKITGNLVMAGAGETFTVNLIIISL